MQRKTWCILVKDSKSLSVRTVDSGIIFTSLTIKVFKYYIPFLEKSYEKSMNILKRFPLGAILKISVKDLPAAAYQRSSAV